MSTASTIGHVTSRDGTSIGYRRTGAGPPLVLVHGASSDHSAAWFRVVDELSKRFTVYAMDRRGRGLSGDSSEYAIEREFEDVAAVVESIGERVNLLGHSYGGVCSLEAALLTSNVRKLVIYEGGISVPGDEVYPPGFIERMQEQLGDGDREGVIISLLRELVRMPPEEIESLCSQPGWLESRAANAHTVPREMAADYSYRFDPARFTGMTTPTLLLLGGESPESEKRDADTLAATLPDARIVVLPGQGHAAHATAPEIFTGAVIDFLLP